jgi:hypothetical protein|tara:strand:- start:539 stop:1573 length:1035 start_codon:yes stop_codon:yes gene_type:complete
MKISIGTNIQDGPWGGGNLFAINFSTYLIEQGHEVVFDLKDDNIDIILLTEPRKTSPSSAFTNYDILNYINYINCNALVVHRINECDEHKDTNFINKYIAYANKSADATVFVSTWMKEIYQNYQEIVKKPQKVILAGANQNIFNSLDKQIWNPKNKLKLVTHHWSNNWNKGFEVYKKIDELLDEELFNSHFEFTFIGRLPDNFEFKNVNKINPLSGENLVKELKKNDFYITGTINEPSGNHHIEAAQCGLPILYMDSGGVKEYCEGFGIEFQIYNLREKIYEAYDNYDFHNNNIQNYPRSSEQMSIEFLKFFEKILLVKNELIEKRSPTNKSILKTIYFNLKSR